METHLCDKYKTKKRRSVICWFSKYRKKNSCFENIFNM